MSALKLSFWEGIKLFLYLKLIIDQFIKEL